MTRLVASAIALLFLTPAFADDAKPKAVAKGIAFNLAMSAAREHLTRNSPREAVDLLEEQLPNADGSRAFLGLLRDAYVAELKQLEASATPDAVRLAHVKTHLNQLGRPEPVPAAAPAVPAVPTPAPAAVAPPEADPLKDARALFAQQRFADAGANFAQAKGRNAAFTADDSAKWAYCRVKLAADRVNAAGCDPATAAAAAQDVADALKLVPDNAVFQQKAAEVLTAARQKAGNRATAPVTAAPVDGWEVIETANFRVRHKGARDLADSIAKAAEAKRAETFEKWSGPASGAWEPKCLVVLHPTATDYARGTGKPSDGTGNTTVKLTNGRATERRIDLRADDSAAAANALPRELTHVVLADLFPDKPPPKWAEEGMAILAGTEADKFTRALPRCAERGEWIALTSLVAMKDVPAEKVAGFYCESVSVVEYLVKAGGARNFTIFLREIDRYGIAAALRRTYSLDGPQALEAAWRRAAMEGVK